MLSGNLKELQPMLEEIYKKAFEDGYITAKKEHVYTSFLSTYLNNQMFEHPSEDVRKFLTELFDMKQEKFN